jgi:hypothetical protein
MKKIIPFILVIFLFACKQKETVSNELNSKTIPSASINLDTDYGKKSDTINYTNPKGIKQGKWIEFKNDTSTNDHQVKIREGQYINNMKTGVWKEYYDDEAIKFILTYRNDTLNGYAIGCDNKGNVFKEGSYKDGVFVEAKK